MIAAGALNDCRYPPAVGTEKGETKVIYIIDLEQYRGIKTKSPVRKSYRALLQNWRQLTLPHFIAVPSARRGLTSLFGMGRGEHPR